MQKHRGIWLALLLALLAAAVLAPVAAMASEPKGIPIDADHFPNRSFRDYVSINYDGDRDGYLSSEEIEKVTYINVHNQSMRDLTGIRYFTALEKLDCGANELTALDVSGCTALETLSCADNKTGMTKLDVSGCTSLKTLQCTHSFLSSLDASGCAALETLQCDANRLTSLDVSGCASLSTLYCYSNQLTALDVSDCAALRTLQCYNNQLTALDVSGCAALSYLECKGNSLTALDVSKNAALETLNCGANPLTALDVSGCAKLKKLSCLNTSLTALDVSGCANLEELDCSSNTSLTSLDASGCTALETLYCTDSRLTSLNVSGCTALDTLYCNNNSLTSLDVSGNTALGRLGCVGNQLTSLDVSQNTKLSTLSCSDNQLTSLDVAKNTELRNLYCYNNQLTELDVTNNTQLVNLNCQNNQLTTLDVTKNEKMDWLICRDQNVLLEVERRPDDTWSADLAERVAGWKEHFENIEANPAEVWDETTDTVAWSKGTVWPTVTYDFDTEFTDTFEDPPLRIKMNVTLTLVPLGVGTEADVTRAVVKGLPGVISGTEITVTLPAGSSLPTAGEIAVTLSRYATMTAPASTDGGRTWTFTVTSEDEQTVKNYTLYMAYDVTVENDDGHGTVTASPNPAREGDTVTLTVTPDPGYMLTGWEVVLGDVTVREDNTFVMPGGAVILRPVFAPISATPPQTGDGSHTGLWLALLLVSLGGLCAAAYAVRRRRSGGAR